MPGGGELRIALLDMQQPPGVELLVSDTGVGMSRQELAAAFKPFHTTKTHGLGVGLPMIRRVMERFGGVVLISSAENAGTQVRLRFRT
jgi:signal transduction histidine kinase